MALIFRIGSYKELDAPDALGREWAGWFPRMTETEAYEAGRGAWRLGPRADHESFALVVSSGSRGTVLAAVEIDSLTPPDPEGRRSVVGRVLEAGHPVRDSYVGGADPLDNTSRNPVGYLDLPEEEEFRIRACACGCGTETRRDFAPGHDQRAIHDRIKTHFGGSTLDFLHWMDQNGPAAGGYDERNGPPEDGNW